MSTKDTFREVMFWKGAYFGLGVTILSIGIDVIIGYNELPKPEISILVGLIIIGFACMLKEDKK